MSAEVLTENPDHFFCETYHAKLKLNNLTNIINKKFIMPAFCPLRNFDVKLCFEIWIEDYWSNSEQYQLYKFVLIKLGDSIAPASLKLEIEMKVLQSNKHVVKEFRNLPIIIVKEMDFYCFDAIRTCGIFSSLLVDCRMMFFGHLEDCPSNILPPVLSSLKTSATISGDIKSCKRSDANSDIIIFCASKLFFAHKSVLAYHSTVFKQMMTQKSDQETVLVLDDNISEAFENFMNYLYSGNFEEASWPMVKDLYVLSAKYEVDSLKKKCAAAIVSYLAVDKISEILKVAYDYEDLSLKVPATKFALDNIRVIISSEDWKVLIASHPHIGYDVTARALNI